MLTPSELLEMWEKGIEHTMFERALLLLEGATGEPKENLSQLTIGLRDFKLFELREALFGRSLPCITSCPTCNERLELNLASEELRISSKSDAQTKFTLVFDGIKIDYRLPTSNDLALASSEINNDNARKCLLSACIIEACQDHRKLTYEDLPAMVLESLSSAMADADPQSHLELVLTCPACEHAWSAVFDITSYLWNEIQNWAMRTLREVHILASAYGWSETDILALSTLRRQLYLQSVDI
jgi:hypothetical protein